jgi:hypothetical protein
MTTHPAIPKTPIVRVRLDGDVWIVESWLYGRWETQSRRYSEADANAVADLIRADWA